MNKLQIEEQILSLEEEKEEYKTNRFLFYTCFVTGSILTILFFLLRITQIYIDNEQNLSSMFFISTVILLLSITCHLLIKNTNLKIKILRIGGNLK